MRAVTNFWAYLGMVRKMRTLRLLVTLYFTNRWG
jgi:hypothetical protein